MAMERNAESDIRPWVPFSFDGEEFLVKALVRESPPNCDVLITDLTHVWRETLTEGEILERAEVWGWVGSEARLCDYVRR